MRSSRRGTRHDDIRGREALDSRGKYRHEIPPMPRIKCSVSIFLFRTSNVHCFPRRLLRPIIDEIPRPHGARRAHHHSISAERRPPAMMPTAGYVTRRAIVVDVWCSQRVMVLNGTRPFPTNGKGPRIELRDGARRAAYPAERRSSAPKKPSVSCRSGCARNIRSEVIIPSGAVGRSSVQSGCCSRKRSTCASFSPRSTEQVA